MSGSERNLPEVTAACREVQQKKKTTNNHLLVASFIFLWAALIGLSRIFAGKHYFGDVLVGAVMGFLTGYVIAVLFRRIATKPESPSPSGSHGSL